MVNTQVRPGFIITYLTTPKQPTCLCVVGTWKVIFLKIEHMSCNHIITMVSYRTGNQTGSNRKLFPEHMPSILHSVLVVGGSCWLTSWVGWYLTDSWQVQQQILLHVRMWGRRIWCEVEYYTNYTQNKYNSRT